MQGFRFLMVLALATSCFAQWDPSNPVTGVQQQPDGALFQMRAGAMKIQVCSDSIIRMLYSPTSSYPDRPDYVVTKTTWPATAPRPWCGWTCW